MRRSSALAMMNRFTLSAAQQVEVNENRRKRVKFRRRRQLSRANKILSHPRRSKKISRLEFVHPKPVDVILSLFIFGAFTSSRIARLTREQRKNVRN
jgi:hypothetical protein